MNSGTSPRPTATHISVGIGSKFMVSEDGGRNWTERPRDVPKGVPIVSGPLAPGGRLPDPSWTLTEVALEAGGLGIAAGFEPAAGDGARKSFARFLRSRDGGRSWEAIRPEIGFIGRLRAGARWPPERVDSAAARPDSLLAFAWEDPWLHEGPSSHLVVSSDAGESWRYARMPDSCTRIARGPGPLRVLGAGRIASAGGRRFPSRTTRLAWDRPPGYTALHGLLREAVFVSEHRGFSLAVDWHAEGLRPPIVGLARTEDDGLSWEVVKFWERPRAWRHQRAAHAFPRSVDSSVFPPSISSSPPQRQLDDPRTRLVRAR